MNVKHTEKGVPQNNIYATPLTGNDNMYNFFHKFHNQYNIGGYKILY